MKKFWLGLFVFASVTVLGVTCFAKTYENRDMGIRLTLSDKWMKTYFDNSTISFETLTQNQNEVIAITAVANDMAYDLSLLGIGLDTVAMVVNQSIDSGLYDFVAERYGSECFIKEEYAQTSWGIYNSVEYIKYDRTVIVSGNGFVDTRFYYNCFITAKNGNLYMFMYQRDDITNNFSDVLNMINSISYDLGEVKIKINGQRIYPDTSPMIIEGRTLVPIRAIAEAIGYDVYWDGDLRIVGLESNDKTNNVLFEINSTIALKNLTEVFQLDVPAMIFGGRTYLPLRAAVESMNAQVNWDGYNKTVEIWK